MKETEEHIVLLRYMSAVLRERKSRWTMSVLQRDSCEKGIIALEMAVAALQVQVYA